MHSSHWLASRLIGDTVRNSAGETLGRINELVIEPASGQIDFAVLLLDAFVGSPERFIAVPWNALGVMAGRDYVLLDMDKNVLSQAPWFAERDWPDFADPTWRSSVYRCYGVTYPAVAPTRVVVEHRDYRLPRKRTSVLGSIFLFLVLLVLAGFAYLIASRGWERAKADTLRSFYDVAYAMKETSGDAAITTKVKMALSLNKSIPEHDIHVETNDGIVTLSGHVDSDETRTVAGKVAGDTPGVLQVHNDLDLMSPGK
jgi:sporulation protein YlmC with PRC-barrel domain